MTHIYQNPVSAANEVKRSQDGDYRASYLIVEEPEPINAKDLEDAAIQINDWLAEKGVKSGWVQYFSSVDYYMEGYKDWEPLKHPPIVAEFTIDGGSLVIRHLGGLKWGRSVFRETAKDGKDVVAEDVSALAERGVFQRCAADNETPIPEKLLYTWYWTEHTEGKGDIARSLIAFKGFEIITGNENG